MSQVKVIEEQLHAQALNGMTTMTDKGNDFKEMSKASLRFSEVNLQTGIRMRYAEQGDTGGRPVIFLHGYTDSWFSFSPVLPCFDAAYRLFALDQRGHGGTVQPEDGYAMTDFASDVIGFMDALELESAILVGHSMGSFIARQVAYKAPHLLEKLVLVGSAPRACNEGIIELQRAVEALSDPVPVEFAREFQESTVYRPLPEDFMQRVVRESLKLPARVWRSVLKGLMDMVDTSVIGDISIPTLILWGDRDSIFDRAEQDALAASLQNAVLKIYPETGHALHWERPRPFAEDLKDFIARRDLEAGRIMMKAV
jgi:non-heme chloroperoxidase